MLKTKYVKIPTKAVIFFSVLLTATSFYSGLAYNKLRSGTVNSTADSANTFIAEKSKKPQLQVFIMSFCPYGNQMEDLLRPVFDLIGSKADIKPQYIFDKIEDLPTHCKARSGDSSQCAAYVESKYFQTIAQCQETISKNYTTCTDENSYIKTSNGTYYASLHGRVEANQNVREMCAWNLADDKTKWWNFIDNVNQNCNSQNADTCWEEQAKKADYDTNKITECFNKQAIDLIEAQIAVTDEYQVSGSPTLIINGVRFPPEQAYTQDGKGSLTIGKETFTQDKYRTPNVIKEAICSAFNKAPKECKQELAEPEQKTADGGC